MQSDPRAFVNRLSEQPRDDDEGRGHRALSRLSAQLGENEEFRKLVSLLESSVPVRELLAGIYAGSPFLFGISERHPEMLQEVLLSSPEATFAETLSQTELAVDQAHSMRDVMAALRKSKTQVALLAALADLGGVWRVEEVTLHLSKAADLFVSLAIRYLFHRAAEAGQYTPRDAARPEEGTGLIVLGMGKFGALELNYSSDIDLVVFYEPEIAPLAANVEAQAFFVRLTRDLVHILQERTADGYVFRTDLRLRPDPGSTQAAISTEAAYHYYESYGQNWERAAMIKARPVAGDINAANIFLAALSPYVWRKYLDYNAILDIHAMKRQIHAAKGHANIAVAGHNLKLGRGGIREIEFFVQSQQLIAGGRQQDLRVRQTLEALNRLADLGWIGIKARDELSDAYRFLRRIEHRLQMVSDQQTHSLPKTADALRDIARFAGYLELSDFERDLRHHMQAVENHYAALFEDVPELTPKRVTGNLVFTGDADDPATLETLSTLGFKNPPAAIAIIKGWHYGRYRAMRSAHARERLTEFTPALLEALGETAEPDLALSSFDKFLSELPASLQLFAMLRANPSLLHLLARIMGSAPRLARILSRRRRLMDAILDPGYLGLRPSKDEVRALMHREISDAQTYEDRLDRVRVVGQEQIFSVGVGLLSHNLTPEEGAEAYSLVADVVIETLLEVVHAEFGGQMPPPSIIAMGKLGGQEMTATSDLDLIVVYDTGTEAQLSQHYARFTQRLIGALSAPTAEGQLYQVDMRLRPSGRAGPVAVPIEGFASYQFDQAWTWEHLALTRARVVAGPADLRDRLSVLIQKVLASPRDPAKAAADVRDMRALVEKEKGTGDIWDTKNYSGGLVDVEFVAQFLQIVHASSLPEILSQNTVLALKNSIGAGFLDPAKGEILIRAASLYQRITQILRLCTDGRFHVASASRDLVELLLHETGEPDVPRLEATLRESYSSVAAIFAEVVQ